MLKQVADERVSTRFWYQASDSSGGMASRKLTTKAQRHKEFVFLVAWCLCGKVAFPKIKMLEERTRRSDGVNF
jgi:hypothetical protein